MKATSTLKKGLARVERAWQAGKYAKAFAEVQHLLQKWPDNPHLLVLWADLLQLQDTDEEPRIEKAKAAYRRAAELDSEAAEPFVGLGHYLSAVEDDPKGASVCFSKAIEISREWLREALLAQAKALTELGREQQAFDCLAQAHWLTSHNGKKSNGVSGREILNRQVK